MTTQPIPNSVRAQVLHNLQDSYHGLTEAYVDEEINMLLAGKKPTNIIGMLAESMLKKAGYLP